MTPLLCLTVETRPLPNLIEYIRQHLDMLPSYTELAIVCGPTNQDILYKEFPNALLYSVDRSLDNPKMYNRLLTSPAFWENWVGYHRALVFQHDSIILRPGIEEFLEMDCDFIGAEWKFPPYRPNGGLSLRNPRAMVDICKRFQWDSSLGNEDVALANFMVNNGVGNLASVEQCRKFSVESVFTLGSWGAHAIDVWLSPEQVQQIKTQYL